MRAVVDTNVLINYLLSRTPASSAAWIIFQAASHGSFTLLLLESVVAELNRKLQDNSRLASRIAQRELMAFMTLLHQTAEIAPTLPEPYQGVGRDRNDDFLIAHSVFARADCLVTWDKDLLALNELDGIRIVTPPTFPATLRAAGAL